MSEANTVIDFAAAKARSEGMAYIEQMYSYYDGKLSEPHLYMGRLYDDVDIDLLDIED